MCVFIMKENKKLSNKGSYTLIWCNKNEDGSYDLLNPKNLIGMNLDKAVGSLGWTKKILTKSKICFIYDPEELSIFNEDGSQNIENIELLIKLSRELKEEKA